MTTLPRRSGLSFVLLACLASWAADRNSLPAAVKGNAQRRLGGPKKAPPPKFDATELEVFFTDAREKLGPGQPGGRPATNPGQESSTPEGGDTATAGQGFAWSTLISPGTIEDEIKAQVATTIEATKTPSEFKGGGNKTARINYTDLAVMFGVIAQYDGDVRWKKEAPGLRALYARVASNCKVGTDNSFKEAKARSDDLAELVGGNKIQLPAVEGEFKWAEVANRPPLMARMGQPLIPGGNPEGYNWRLKAWTADQGEFSKHREGVIKEAEIVALIAHLIQDESYEYADDESYRGHAEQLRQHALEVVEAANSKSLERAQAAVGQVNQSCTNCHNDFRGGG